MGAGTDMAVEGNWVPCQFGIEFRAGEGRGHL